MLPTLPVAIILFKSIADSLSFTVLRKRQRSCSCQPICVCHRHRAVEHVSQRFWQIYLSIS